jgi:hypothetical protein
MRVPGRGAARVLEVLPQVGDDLPVHVRDGGHGLDQRGQEIGQGGRTPGGIFARDFYAR